MTDDPHDDSRLELGTPEWEREREHRRGRPRGPHVKPHDDDGPPHVSDYLRDGSLSDLRDTMRVLRMGENGTPPTKPKFDLSLNIPTIVLLGGMVLTGLQGWTTLNERVAENARGVQDSKDRAAKYVPVIEGLREAVQAQTGENKMQNDRINAVVDSLVEERKQRGSDSMEARKAMQEIMVLIGKYADKLADIDKAVAVMQSGGRRSEISPPVRDAQAQRGP